MDEEILHNSSEVGRWSLRDIFEKRLIREFVEARIENGNRWPESEADQLRFILNNSSDEEVGRAVAESEIYRRWKEINERNFSGEELTMVVAFTRFLDTADEDQGHGEFLSGLMDSLYALKKCRMQALGVSEDAIREDEAHTRAVEAKMPPGMGKIMAILHDVSKYSAVKDGDEVRQVRNVGIHEATSAILAGEILREALLGSETVAWINRVYGDTDDARNYIKIAETAIGFMESAIAAHGHQEFPMKVSKGRPLPEVDGAYIYQPAPVMQKEVYLGAYMALEQRIVGNVDGQDFLMLQKYYEGLREADMMVGIDPNSFVKYFNEALPGRVFSMNSASEYVHTFAGTAIEYLRDAPNVLGLRERPDVDNVNTKVGFLFTVMHATETLSADKFEDLAESVVAELNPEDREAMRGIFRQAWGLHQSFLDYKTSIFERGERDEGSEVRAKKDLADKFALMVKNIINFDYHKLKSLDFNNEIKSHMRDLENRLTKN